MSIAKTIRQLRERKGMTQAQLAKASKLTVTYINLVENEKKSPTLTSLEKISGALEIPFPIIAFLSLDPKKDLKPEKQKVFELLAPEVNELIEKTFFEEPSS